MVAIFDVGYVHRIFSSIFARWRPGIALRLHMGSVEVYDLLTASSYSCPCHQVKCKNVDESAVQSV